MPAPLRGFLPDHTVATAYEMGWANLSNGDLLGAAESEFDLLVTTDQSLRYQENLSGRRLAILVLATTSWPKIRSSVTALAEALRQVGPGEFRELSFDA
ncbi:MAG: hypothetical protein ABW221_25075 [Vicinamibacteria bacterium]